MSKHFLLDDQVCCYDDDSLPFPQGSIPITEGEAEEYRIPFSDRIEHKCAELEESYRAAIDAPISYTTVGGVTSTFQANDSSRTVLQNTTAGYMGRGEVPAWFAWMDCNNEFIPFVYADLLGLAAAMVDRGAVAFFSLQTKKAQARATLDAQALALITF